MTGFEGRPVVFVHAARKASPLDKIVVGLLLLLVVAVLAFVLRWELADLDSLKKVLGLLAGQWTFWLPIVLAVVFGALTHASLGRYTLVLDGEGIRLDATGLLKLGMRKMRWQDIKSIAHVGRQQWLRLQPHSGLPWLLMLRDWRLPDAPMPPPRLAEPDLLRVLRERGILDRLEVPSGRSIEDFDLAAHPRTRAALVLLGVCGLYAVAERLLQREAWAFFNLAYLLPHIALAAVCAVALGWWVSRPAGGTQVPSGVGAMLSVLSLVAFGAASYAGGIRVNQWVGGPLEEAAYHRDADCMNLLPPAPDLPVIEYTALAKGYWCSIPAKDTVPVLVRRGLFGLYQVDLTPHTQAIRRHREGGR